jgi:hypothetical protein
MPTPTIAPTHAHRPTQPKNEYFLTPNSQLNMDLKAHGGLATSAKAAATIPRSSDNGLPDESRVAPAGSKAVEQASQITAKTASSSDVSDDRPGPASGFDDCDDFGSDILSAMAAKYNLPSLGLSTTNAQPKPVTAIGASHATGIAAVTTRSAQMADKENATDDSFLPSQFVIRSAFSSAGQNIRATLDDTLSTDACDVTVSSWVSGPSKSAVDPAAYQKLPEYLRNQVCVCACVRACVCVCVCVCVCTRFPQTLLCVWGIESLPLSLFLSLPLSLSLSLSLALSRSLSLNEILMHGVDMAHQYNSHYLIGPTS